MRSTIANFVLVLGFVSTAPSAAEAVIVTIDPIKLPSSNQASYVNAWANVNDSTDPTKASICEQLDATGARVECHPSMNIGGDSASADATAQVDGNGVATLSASANAVKVTYSAAAAYAKGGGTYRKAGALKGTVVTVTWNGLTLRGNIDPIDTTYEVAVSNLGPTELNQRLLQLIARDKSLGADIKALEKNFSVSSPKEEFLTLRADFAANGTLKITATAPNLCDPQPGVSMQDLHKVAAKVCGPKKDFVQKAAFSDPCKDKAQFAQYDDCKKKGIKIVVLDKQPLTYTFFIPAKDDNKEELVNISIDQIQLVKSRKGKGNGQKAQ